MLLTSSRPTPSDIDIAQAAKLRPIQRHHAQEVGLTEDDLDYFTASTRPRSTWTSWSASRTAPTASTLTSPPSPPPRSAKARPSPPSVSAQALTYLGKKVFTCIRQPSQGPTFGIKGGAAGGGYCPDRAHGGL